LDSLELVTAATSNLALLPYVVSLACAIAVTLFALARSEVRSARTYAVVTAGEAAWITGFLFELTRTTVAGKVAWDHVEFAAMCLCAVALLNFAAGETGRRVPRSWLAALGVPCLAGLLYVVLNPVARASARIVPGRLPALLYDFTWVDLAAFAYTMVLVLVANALFLRQVLIRRGVYRTQALLLFLGGMLPLLSAVFLAVGVTVLGQRDTTPFTFAASNLITSWALFRHRLFELVPVARGAVFESLQDSVLVFDREGQLVDLNAATGKGTGLGLSIVYAVMEQNGGFVDLDTEEVGGRPSISSSRVPGRRRWWLRQCGSGIALRGPRPSWWWRIRSTCADWQSAVSESWATRCSPRAVPRKHSTSPRRTRGRSTFWSPM
jgi:hypothetical protein